MKILLITPGCVGYKLLEIYADMCDELIVLGYTKYKRKFNGIIGQADQNKIKNVKFKFANSRLTYLKLIFSTVRTNKINVIVSQDPMSGLLAFFGKVFGGGRSIHVMCSDHIKSFSHIPMNKILKSILSFAMWFQLRIACSSSDVVTLSKYLKRKAKEYGAKRIEVIPAYGVDTEMFKPLKQDLELKKKLNINEEKIIFTAARFTPEKGIEYLIRAFKKINEKEKETKLLIVGYGSEENYLKDTANKLNLQDKIIFTGSIKHKDIIKYYNLCDIFVMPSMIEGLGFSSAEALACEKPVVASNVGGIPDIIINGKTGFLVKPKDTNEIAEKVLILLQDKNLSVRFGKAGRNHVKELFEEKKVAEKLKKFCLER